MYTADRALCQQAYDILRARATDGCNPALQLFMVLDDTLHVYLEHEVVKRYLHILNVLTPPLLADPDVALYRDLHRQLEEHHQPKAEWLTQQQEGGDDKV